MNEDQIREAMIATIPQHLRPRKFMPRTNGGQDRRIDHSRVVSMKAEGSSTFEIADAVFCEVGTVYAILRTHRLNGGTA